jgi:hypothetical protein
LITILAYDIQRQINNKNFKQCGRQFRVGAFVFLSVFFTMQVIYAIDLVNVWDAENDTSRYVNIQDAERVASLCSCDISTLSYLFTYADCYWASDVLMVGPNITDVREDDSCGDRLIGFEQIMEDYLDTLKCGIHDIDALSTQQVYVKVGDGYEQLSPIWSIVTPILLLLISILFTIMKKDSAFRDENSFDEGILMDDLNGRDKDGIVGDEYLHTDGGEYEDEAVLVDNKDTSTLGEGQDP